MPPVIGVDDAAERDVAEEDDIGAEQIGLPGPVAEQDAEAGGDRPEIMIAQEAKPSQP
jgi:hypothetical protein